MKDHKRPATIVAIENSQLYRMDEEDFRWVYSFGFRSPNNIFSFYPN